MNTDANSRKQISYLLLLIGALGILFGGLHLLTYFSTGSAIVLADAGINALLGILGLITAWLLLKGKILAVGIAVLYVLIGIIYAYAIGRGINFISIGLGGLIVGWLVILWRRGVLT